MLLPNLWLFTEMDCIFFASNSRRKQIALGLELLANSLHKPGRSPQISLFSLELIHMRLHTHTRIRMVDKEHALQSTCPFE